ncbi:MAG TPA: hypothetical protein DEF51_31725, partial [Myxococcales bacterium]|nr:hypothetical protein [Myxococcales bacterium]
MNQAIRVRTTILAFILAVAGCGEAPTEVDSGTSPVTDSGPSVDGGRDDPDSGPAPSCDDGVLNQDESDVDCGGVCGATCTVGDMCGGVDDCMTMLCTEGTCDALPTCTDAVQNGMET